MSTVTENITPAKAHEYLKTSLGNRVISKVYVRSYADTMRKGKWMLNGVPIIFDYDGHLIDGHHRLLAVEEAGIPVQFDVCRGVSPESFVTYDNGRHRTIGQLLSMQRVKNYNLVGAIVAANDRLICSGRLYENNTSPTDYGDGGSKRKKMNADKYDAFRRDSDGFIKTAEYIKRLEQKGRIIYNSWAGGLCYFLTHTGGYKEEVVFPFFEALYSPEESCTIQVISLLRKAIVKEAIEGRKMKAETLWAFIAKSWNYYITGETPKILRYQSSREVIPALILNTKE